MEKVPRKKEKRPVKRGAVLLILLGLLIALGAAAYFLRPREEAPEIPEAPEKIALVSRPSSEISALEITPRAGESYRLESGENGLRLADRPEQPLRQDVTEEIGLMAAEMIAENVAWEGLGQAPWADFGLDAPAVRIDILYTDGEEKTVLLGDLSPEETPQRYAALMGDGRVFTVLEAECEPFFYEKDYLRDFDQPALDASLLDRIQVAGDIALDLRYTPSGWLMEAPYQYPAAAARMDLLLSRIERMGFEACLGDEEEADLDSYGLAAPALTVTLTQAASVIEGETTTGERVSIPVPEREYTLCLGNETGRSGVYLLWQGQVFKASNFLLGFWKELEADALLLQQPVNFLVNDLRSVSVTAGGAAAAYAVAMVESVAENNRIATDEYGRVLYECEITRLPGGEAVDQEEFLNWYAGLASLKAAGRLPEGYAPQGEPEAALTLKSNSITREILLYPYDGLHDALSVNGTALYYVQRDWLDTAAKAP